MNRRNFIRNSLATGVILLGGVSAYQWYQQSGLDYSKVRKLKFLTADDQVLLSVLIPVIGNGIPHQPEINLVIENIEEAIIRLPQRTQDELRDLFDGLSTGFGRLVLAGVWLNWQTADPQSINKFVSSWRDHSLGLLQDAYLGLHKMILGGIYAEDDTWKAIGYSGPPF